MSKGGGRGRGGKIAIAAVINNNDNGLKYPNFAWNSLEENKILNTAIKWQVIRSN